jgi:hypothetical protein
MLSPGIDKVPAVEPWLITIIPTESIKDFTFAASELDCGPITIRIPFA